MIKERLSTTFGSNIKENAAIVIQNVSIGDLIGNVYPAFFEGLIDTGADRSVIPMTICKDLKLKIHDQLKVVGFDGKARECTSYLVYVKVETIGDVPLQVFGVERKGVLLGRDFLKNMLLVMDSRVQKYGLGISARWKTTCLRLMGIL